MPLKNYFWFSLCEVSLSTYTQNTQFFFPFAHTYAQQPIEAYCVSKLQKCSHEFYTMPTFLCLFLPFSIVNWKAKESNSSERKKISDKETTTTTIKKTPELIFTLKPSSWNECTIRLKWLSKKSRPKMPLLENVFSAYFAITKGKN